MKLTKNRPKLNTKLKFEIWNWVSRFSSSSQIKKEKQWRLLRTSI